MATVQPDIWRKKDKLEDALIDLHDWRQERRRERREKREEKRQ